jgi:hypothetical protein
MWLDTYYYMRERERERERKKKKRNHSAGTDSITASSVPIFFNLEMKNTHRSMFFSSIEVAK